MKLFAAALALTSALAAHTAYGESPPPPVCDEPPAEFVTEIDLYESTVETNTLHLDGGELRFGNVGEFRSQDLDLKIVITGGDYTDIAQVWIDKEKGPSGVGDPDELNGKKPDSKFGNINLQTVKNKPKSGEAQLRFCFVESGTDTPVTLQQFSFTTYDTDERGVESGKVGIKEKLIIDTSQAAYYQLGTDTVDTELITTCEDGSDPDPLCPDGERTIFTSTTKGPGSDNPTDPDDLTNKQISRSVMFTFRDTSCWEFTYDHFCPADQPGWTGSRNDCAYYTGGNFLFAGSSEQLVEHGECITKPPDPTPDPTNAPPTPDPTPVPTNAPPTPDPTPDPTNAPPTPDPTPDPTNAPPTPDPTPVPTNAPPTPDPTPDPTNAPPTPDPTPNPTVSTPEPTPGRPPQGPTPPDTDPCPEDVVVIHTDGVTEFPVEGAVRIISQNTTTVTLELYNAWSSEQDVIDSIFYNYRINQFDEKCYEKEYLMGNENYDTITIQCLHTQPYAKLDICVADGCTNSLAEGDNGEIPKCCEDTVLPPGTQVVCYKLLIQCETLCPEASERRALRGASAV